MGGMCMYRDGDVTLYHGDCLEVMPVLQSGSIDLTVTSPPYDNLRTYGKDFDADSFDWHPIIAELYRVTKQGGVVVWVVADATINGSETGTSFQQALWAMECGFNLHDTMIYSTNKPPLNHNRYERDFEYMFVFSRGKPSTFNPIRIMCKYAGGSQSPTFRHTGSDLQKMHKLRPIQETKIKGNIWHYNSGTTSGDDRLAFEHPASFPEALAHDHILSWSNPGDVVLDPMMGSGTTGKMAVKLQRRFIGIELDANYYTIAQQRIAEARLQLPLL